MRKSTKDVVAAYDEFILETPVPEKCLLPSHFKWEDGGVATTNNPNRFSLEIAERDDHSVMLYTYITAEDYDAISYAFGFDPRTIEAIPDITDEQKVLDGLIIEASLMEILREGIRDFYGKPTDELRKFKAVLLNAVAEIDTALAELDSSA